MKMLVTGGAGFIGSQLVDQLRLVHEVMIVDSLHSYYDPAWKQRRLNGLLEDASVSWVCADICDEDQLKPVFEFFRPERVIHLAAMPGVQPSLSDPALYVDVDVKGTVQLLSLSAEYEVSRFVFASSSSVYGANGDHPCKEGDVLEPVSPYAAAKAAGEIYCRTYERLYGLPVTINRLFTVYGPEQRPDMALWKFSKQLFMGQPIKLYGVNVGRDYTYIADTVDGFVRAVTLEQAAGRTYNIGSGRIILIQEVIRLLEAAFGRKAQIEYQELPRGDVPLTWADTEQAERELGFKASVSIAEGIQRFVTWFLQHQQL